MSNYREKLSKINTFIFDYDGVLTDCTVIIDSTGNALRRSNVKDGYALQLAVKKNYKVAVISGGYSDTIKMRMDSLNIKDVFMSVEKKIDRYEQYLTENNITDENVLFMGDDIPDYPLMQRAGVATCPADAAEEIKSLATYISHHKGGRGCVRDVIEQVMKVQGLWMNDDAYHW